MKAIYFVEIEGKKHYKTDTFWSKSSKFTDAKIHDDSENDKKRFFTSLCDGFKPWNIEELNDEEFEPLKKYYNSLYGYQILYTTEAKWLPSEDDKLSEPIYLKRIDSINKKGEVEFTDAIVLLRDKKINEIMK